MSESFGVSWALVYVNHRVCFNPLARSRVRKGLLLQPLDSLLEVLLLRLHVLVEVDVQHLAYLALSRVLVVLLVPVEVGWTFLCTGFALGVLVGLLVSHTEDTFAWRGGLLTKCSGFQVAKSEGLWLVNDINPLLAFDLVLVAWHDVVLAERALHRVVPVLLRSSFARLPAHASWLVRW